MDGVVNDDAVDDEMRVTVGQKIFSQDPKLKIRYCCVVRNGINKEANRSQLLLGPG